MNENGVVIVKDGLPSSKDTPCRRLLMVFFRSSHLNEAQPWRQRTQRTDVKLCPFRANDFYSTRPMFAHYQTSRKGLARSVDEGSCRGFPRPLATRRSLIVRGWNSGRVEEGGRHVKVKS